MIDSKSNLNCENFRIEIIISNLISLNGIDFICLLLIIFIARPFPIEFLVICNFIKKLLYLTIIPIKFSNILFSIFLISN